MFKAKKDDDCQAQGDNKNSYLTVPWYGLSGLKIIKGIRKLSIALLQFVNKKMKVALRTNDFNYQNKKKNFRQILLRELRT
jgi:hypothetical protein